jgi:hypothetical protein
MTVPEDVHAVMAEGRSIPCQMVREGQERILYFTSPEVLAFSFRQLQLSSSQRGGAGTGGLSASAAGL